MAFASPATVSRAGMVYVDPKNLGYLPYWQRWMDNRHPDEQETLGQLYAKFVPPLLEYIHEGVDGSNQEEPLTTIISQSTLNMVTQLCHMYDALLPLSHSISDDEQQQQQIDVVINTDVVSAMFLLVSLNAFACTDFCFFVNWS